MFQPFGFKWGPTAKGTASGQVEWSSDFAGDIPKAAGYSNQDFENALQEAFDTWESVAAIDFVKVNNSDDIVVTAGALGGNTLGQASIPSGGLTINDSTIIIDSSNVGGTPFVWSPYGQTGNTFNFFTVALHEIGHSIGLDHVVDSSQIMNGSISNSLETLASGDIDGAQSLYGKDAGDVDAVEAPDESTPSGDPSGDPGAEASGGGGGAAILGILGLLAFLFSGIFSGGAAIALAAATGEPEGDKDEPQNEPDNELLEAFLASMPTHDHDHNHSHVHSPGDGHICDGLCGCAENQDDLPFLL